MAGKLGEGLRTAKSVGAAIKDRVEEEVERHTRPTDEQIVQRFLNKGITDVVAVACSITSGIHYRWEQLTNEGKMNLTLTTNEHALPGIAAGIWLGTGRISILHMQNSGFTNNADGVISLLQVCEIPAIELVTWRGNNKLDDSEPHQQIGKKTSGITREVIGNKKLIHGERSGKGILLAIDSAIKDAHEGEIGLIRLSPDAFTKTIQLPVLADRGDIFLPDVYRAQREKEQRIKDKKGTFNDHNPLQIYKPITRDEALKEIIAAHGSPSTIILFCNGFTARAAQKVADRIGNFYNVGFMGGTLAMGWALARSNPYIKVVVVDGDQNAEMGTAKEHLRHDYPDNLNWYILDNGIGASVGTARSLPLESAYYEYARVIPTIPDDPGSFNYPRVKAQGVYFDLEEAREMADLIGPLPVHAKRLRQRIEQLSDDHILLQSLRQETKIRRIK